MTTQKESLEDQPIFLYAKALLKAFDYIRNVKIDEKIDAEDDNGPTQT